MQCTACGKSIPPEFPPQEGESESPYQGDNNLWLGFFGGYGMFVEAQGYVSDNNAQVLKDTRATYEANLCHDCAHALCEAHPWLAKLLQPERAHSHTEDFWKDNPLHEGWDKPSPQVG